MNGSHDCLPGVPGNACCPIVHYNSFLEQFVMVYNTWGQDSTMYVSRSIDGIHWGASMLLLQAGSNRTFAYGQILGEFNSSVAGETAVLAYAAAPPVGDQPRDFVYRSITFVR